MTSDIVVRPADNAAPSARIALALREFSAVISDRFPEASGPGVTNALADRPIVTDGEVVIRAEVPSRPMVLHEVMRLAGPLQLRVQCPEMRVDADPRHRIVVDVHRAPSTANAEVTDHDVLGRPYGTLPWITRSLLDSLIADLTREGDELIMEAAPHRWLQLERVSDGIRLVVSDGPDQQLRRMTVDEGAHVDALDIAWSWVACDPRWRDHHGWECVRVDQVRMVC